MQRIEFLVIALNKLSPGCEFTISGDNYDIDWIKCSIKPTQEQIDQEVARLEAEYSSKEYQRQRAPEYPSIGDQLDALFKAGVFPADMAAQIQAVKDKYPKA